jgi:quinol monooxygenase YgiN
MPLYTVVDTTTTPDQEELFLEIASLLQENTEKSAGVFNYHWIRECADLASELTKTVVCTMKLARLDY